MHSANVSAAIHAANARWALAVTGGGVTAAGELLSVPGGSQSILEVVVPYDERALADFLGFTPAQACSQEASCAMAQRALDRARWLAPGERVFGLACTASLASTRPKRGDHRVHVAVAGEEGSRSWSLTLEKGNRDRLGEEQVAAGLVLTAMARTLGLAGDSGLTLLPTEKIEEHGTPCCSITSILARDGAVFVGEDGHIEDNVCWRPDQPCVLVPGAFNPLHRAHWRLANEAARLTGLPFAFELSVANVDKPEVTGEEVRRRLTQFAGHAGVWVTRAPRFSDKARLFPGAVFAVGVDTAQRLVDPRYYDSDERKMAAALHALHDADCRFFVAGRADDSGRYCSLNDVAIPPLYRTLFIAIGEDVFREDVSSTALRKQSP